MTKTIDYYFSLISPWTYMGDAKLREIASRAGARIVYKPMKLATVFPATGGLPLAKRAPQRQDYRLVELARWSASLGLPLTLHPKYFPADESRAAALVLAALANGEDVGKLVYAILSAVWVGEGNIADDQTLRQLADGVGLDGEKLLIAADSPDSLAEWDKNSEDAITVGVFGSPFYVINGEPFWGQDRLHMVEAALR